MKRPNAWSIKIAAAYSRKDGLLALNKAQPDAKPRKGAPRTLRRPENQ
jgi:hypothetical protein